MTLPAEHLAPEEVLDSADALETRDPAGMLRAVASAAAQVREAAALCAEAGVPRLAQEDLPRSVVILGAGASAIAGEVLAVVAGPSCPVPVVTHRGYGLPTWVGAADLVLAVSASGESPQTLSSLDEAVRRGCRLVTVGATGSSLEALAQRGRSLFVPVSGGRPARASLLALCTPLVVAADALGLLACSREEVEATAVLLEQLAGRHRPGAETVLNPAKTLALSLSGCLPMVWGASPIAGVAAHRFAGQLNENAKTPALWGSLPEAASQQIAVLDGQFAGTAGGAADFFRDRVDEEQPERTRLHLVLLRDVEEQPQVARTAVLARDLARHRGVEVSELLAEGSAPFQRLASLISLADWTSTYLALAEGHDPTPVDVVDELTSQLRR